MTTAILVLPAVAKGACMVVSISIRMEGECFEGRIMRRILTSVSGPRSLSRLLRILPFERAGFRNEWNACSYCIGQMRLIDSIIAAESRGRMMGILVVAAAAGRMGLD